MPEVKRRPEMSTDNPDNYPVGVCPDCKTLPKYQYEYRNIGKGQWAFCTEHKRKWLFGCNLFTSWKHETEEDWIRNSDFLSDYSE